MTLPNSLAVAPGNDKTLTVDPVPQHLSPNQRAWARFKRNRMGYMRNTRVRQLSTMAGAIAEPSMSARLCVANTTQIGRAHV